MSEEFIERRSPSLVKPFFFFSLELILLFLLSCALYMLHPYTLILTLSLSLYFINYSAMPRLVKIINRVYDMKREQLS